MHGAQAFRGGPHGRPHHHHHQGPPFGPPWLSDVAFGRRRRMRRGNVRAAMLVLLEDVGLVRAEAEGSGRRFALTDEGRAYVEEHRSELGEPWANLGGQGGAGRDLRRALGETAAAVMQVARAGSPAQTEQARQILVDARKALYRILADDE